MGADAVRDLFVWHALEESEHKAVAFDVYRAVGGGERLRVWTMNFFRFGFVVGMGLAVAASRCSATGPPTAGATCAGAGSGSRRSPIMDPAIWAPAEGLQPARLPPRRQRHDRIGGNLEGELFGEHGTLNDKLIGAAA